MSGLGDVALEALGLLAFAIACAALLFYVFLAGWLAIAGLRAAARRASAAE